MLQRGHNWVRHQLLTIKKNLARYWLAPHEEYKVWIHHTLEMSAQKVAKI